jgi:regulator of PEP synthase PpsR (kinase-PPPase family)
MIINSSSLIKFKLKLAILKETIPSCFDKQFKILPKEEQFKEYEKARAYHMTKIDALEFAIKHAREHALLSQAYKLIGE